MTSRDVLKRRVREGALWLGAVLGVLCLVLAAVAWVFDVRPLVFRSGSMSPEIEAGALALAQEVPASEVSVGDVVSVVDGKGVRVTHRVVSVERAGDEVSLQLKGDANATPDAEAYSVDEVYRVFADVPWAGHVVNALSTPWGLLACGGFVTLLLVTAFGRRGSGGTTDGGTGSGGGDRGRRATRSVAGVATMGFLAVAVAPMGTMATFSDTSQVTGGPLTALKINPATGLRCTSGIFEFLNVRWTHSDAKNIEYRVVVTRVSNGEVAHAYPWQSAPAVGTEMSREIRATGSPSIPDNGDYWATVYSRSQVGKDVGWSAAAPRVPIRRTLGLMYCGH